jgi:hypothetical protein
VVRANPARQQEAIASQGILDRDLKCLPSVWAFGIY